MQSTLLKFNNLPLVIIIPDLLTPGIKARIENIPIIKIFLIFKSLSKFLIYFKFICKYKNIPKTKVDHAIISIFLKILIIFVTNKIITNYY